MKRFAPVILAAGTFLLTLVFAAPAQAHDRHDGRHRVDHRHQRQHKQFKHHDRYDRRSQRQDRYYRHERYERFDVPHRIHDHRRQHYSSYFEGSVYFAPHRHRHAVYQFPVRNDFGWSYRQHFYCEDELFLDHGRVEYHGSRFSIRLGF